MGNFNVVNWLFDQGILPSKGALIISAANGHEGVFPYLIQHHVPMDDVVDKAIRC